MRTLLSSLFVLLLLVSCTGSGEQDIEAILSTREKAYETKDINLYLTCISPKYKEEEDGKVLGIEDIKKRFRANISIFDTIQLTPSDRKMYKRGKQTEVFQKVKVSVKVEKDDGEFFVKEIIGFDKIDGKWKIVKESKADLLSGYVFGDLKQQ